MIKLTDEQRQQLESGRSVEVTDAETARVYVILHKEAFERVRHLVYDDSDWTPDDLRLLLARSSEGNGWDEPGMDAYDRYTSVKFALEPP